MHPNHYLHSNKSHHWITYNVSFHRSFHNLLHCCFPNETLVSSVGIDFWFLWFQRGQVWFSNLEFEIVSGEEIEGPRSQDIKYVVFEFTKLQSNSNWWLISISNPREETPIDLLTYGLRSTVFWMIKLSLSLGWPEILIYNSNKILLIDPLGPSSDLQSYDRSSSISPSIE